MDSDGTIHHTTDLTPTARFLLVVVDGVRAEPAPIVSASTDELSQSLQHHPEAEGEGKAIW